MLGAIQRALRALDADWRSCAFRDFCMSRRCRPRCLQSAARPAALRRRRRHRLRRLRAAAGLRRRADARLPSATTRSATSCATTPSAGWRPPSTTRSGNFVGTFDPRLDSQRDVNYTDARDRARRLRRQPRPQVDPRARGAASTTGSASSTTRTATSAAALNPYGIDLVGRAQDPLLDAVRRSIALERPEPRRRRLDAADAVRARHLQDAAERRRGRRSPSSGARSANGGWRRSSIAS